MKGGGKSHFHLTQPLKSGKAATEEGEGPRHEKAYVKIKSPPRETTALSRKEKYKTFPTRKEHSQPRLDGTTKKLRLLDHWQQKRGGTDTERKTEEPRPFLTRIPFERRHYPLGLESSIKGNQDSIHITSIPELHWGVIGFLPYSEALQICSLLSQRDTSLYQRKEQAGAPHLLSQRKQMGGGKAEKGSQPAGR